MFEKSLDTVIKELNEMGFNDQLATICDSIESSNEALELVALWNESKISKNEIVRLLQIRETILFIKQNETANYEKLLRSVQENQRQDSGSSSTAQRWNEERTSPRNDLVFFVFLKDGRGKTHRSKVKSNETIFELKNRIYPDICDWFPPNNLALTSKGLTLDDQKTLSDSDVQPDDTLFISRKSWSC